MSKIEAPSRSLEQITIPRPSPELEKRKMRRELLTALFAAGLIGLLLLAEHFISGPGGEALPAGHILLFALLSVVVLLLIIIIFFLIRNFFKLVFERRRKILGSHLKTRLSLAFAALTLVPTVLLFIAGAGVLHTSIESWFRTQVEESLESALIVAQAYYQHSSERALGAGTRVSARILDQGLLDPGKRPELTRLMETAAAADGLTAFRVHFRDERPPIVVVAPGTDTGTLPPSIPSFLKIGFAGEKTTKIAPLADRGDLVSAIVPLGAAQDTAPPAVLVIDYHVPNSLSGRLHSVSNAFGDYQEARRMKGPVKTANVLLLLTVALLVILIGFWFGAGIARDITDPILSLAAGAEKIAAGNLDVYIEPVGDDELAVFVRSFNKMAEDLRAGRDELMRVNTDLENRRTYMETVLKNTAAGVLSLDEERNITTVNDSARRLLGISSDTPIGKPLAEALPDVAAVAVEEILQNVQCEETLERQLTISFADKAVSLLCFANCLMDDENRYLGAVLVFEDMTYLIKAQRMAAWREVARRIAHEIKNPLTPISLNAQRLRRKYLAMLGKDGEVLDQCTGAIVEQVEQLKNMVNEFSKFARMPAANPVPNDLNQLAREAVDLYSHGYEGLKIGFIPDPLVPVFDIDKEQMNRALVNLIENAIRAMNGKGEITVRTAFDPVLSIASLRVADNGPGISARDSEHLFEPYYSRTPGGAGLGLTIVSAIISDHNGFIRVRSEVGKGAEFVLELPVRRGRAAGSE